MCCRKKKKIAQWIVLMRNWHLHLYRKKKKKPKTYLFRICSCLDIAQVSAFALSVKMRTSYKY